MGAIGTMAPFSNPQGATGERGSWVRICDPFTLFDVESCKKAPTMPPFRHPMALHHNYRLKLESVVTPNLITVSAARYRKRFPRPARRERDTTMKGTQGAVG